MNYAGGMDLPPYLNPCVLPVETRAAERNGILDMYLPDSPDSAPAIVFVPGGPLPPDMVAQPRDWPIFQAYGSLAASRGVVGVTLNHRLDAVTAYSTGAEDVATVIEMVRADPRVNADRVALWFFSGGSLMSADWLRNPPAWLRCLATSYPMLAPLPGWPVEGRFRPAEAVAHAGQLPIILTRVGRETPEIAATVESFVTAARAADAQLDIIDVPNGQHSFDMLNDTNESRDAINRAFATVLTKLSA